ncbi:MAG: hypothetical protein ACSHWQ_09855 [Spongiibacteraceae bacterium]
MSISPNKIKTRAPREGPESLVATLSLRPLLVELRLRGQNAEILLQPFGISSADVTEPLAVCLNRYCGAFGPPPCK